MDSVSKRYNCPACGFILDFEPWSNGLCSYEICPCCGIQFGYDDCAGGNIQRRGELHKEWRRDWIGSGMPWWSRGAAAPTDWNPAKQLEEFLSG